MPLSQGDDLSWYEEYAPDDYTIGHFRGAMASLNISNADPNMKYYYASNNPNDIVRFLNQGWVPVGPEDPERYGAKRLDAWNIPAALGTERAYQDVVLMKIPIDQYREIQRQKDEYRKGLLQGVTHDYEERGASRARELHRPPQGRSLYYSGSDHGQYIEEK